MRRVAATTGCRQAAALALATLAPGPAIAQQALPAAPAQQAPAPAPAAEPAPGPSSRPEVPGGSPTVADSTASVRLEGLAAQPGGLTVDETVRRVLAASSRVADKRAQLRAANAKIAQTTSRFLPQLMLRATYTRLSPVASRFSDGALVGAQNSGPLSTGPCPMGGGTCVLDAVGEPVGAASFDIETLEDNYALSATLSIPISDYLLQLSDAAASSASSQEAARYAVEAEERVVALEARVLYYNWLRAHAQVDITRKAAERTSARLEDARVAHEVGMLSRADLMRLEAAEANAQLAVAKATSLVALTEAQLAIAMADPAPSYRIGEEIAEVDAPVVDRATTQKLIARALERRAELRSVDAATEAFEHGESATRADAWPRLEAVGDVTYANPNPRYYPPQRNWDATWSAGLRLSWNVTQLFSSDAMGDELSANKAATLAQRRAAEAGIAHEVVSAQLDIANAEAALQASATALAAAKEGYRVTTDRFQVGRATGTDVIEAESDLLGANLGIINARIDLVIATLRLAHATADDAALPTR